VVININILFKTNNNIIYNIIIININFLLLKDINIISNKNNPTFNIIYKKLLN